MSSSVPALRLAKSDPSARTCQSRVPQAGQNRQYIARPEPAMPIESHVQRFPLPGGGAIELGGIAWSETGPFALINGRVVGPGSAFGDYILERIQQGHVELVGDGRRVHLSLQ